MSRFLFMADEIQGSVLVPVFNEERYIEASVMAMRRQQFPGELEFLFADGGSTDRTREILERLAQEDPRIRVFDNPRRSVSSGLNVALRHARGRWAVRMDAHTIYPDNYILLGVGRLQAGGTRWVSGPQIPKGHGPVSRAVALALAGRLGRGGSSKWGAGASASGPEFELDTGVFAGVWELATLHAYGGWDERWWCNEDSEMAARFLAAGERLICVPAMGAEYMPRDNLGGLWRQYWGYGLYRARTSRHHPHSMRASHLLAPGMAVVLVSAIVAPRALRRPARGVVLAYLTCLLGVGGRTLAAADPRGATAADPRGAAALVPAVLATMHFGHGFGQLYGWLRHGAPLRAWISLLGLEGSLGAPPPATARPWAPSLTPPAQA
ncbi:MAG: glycosyltransferase [Actinomycetota bacterium]|nr:glycosyltransferase [Actinomycetota bacterium]